MRYVNFPPLSRSVSAIGLGCASLGSRVSRERGLAALHRAYEAGISWFDVAPSYGYGRAEEILSDFVNGKRDQITLCSKVGRLPGRDGIVSRTLKPLAQHVVRVVPNFRKFARAAGPQQQRAALSGTLIEISLENSLRILQSDHVDVLGLHDATDEEIRREDVLRACEKAVSSGKALCIAIASDLAVAIQAVVQNKHIQIIQVVNNVFRPNILEA